MRGIGAVLIVVSVAGGARSQPSGGLSNPAAAVAVEATTAPAGAGVPGDSGLGAAAPSGEGEGGGEGVPEGLDLSDLIEMATDHPLVGAARAEVDAYQARLRQAQWAQWSGFSFGTLFTFIPPQSGTVFDPPPEEPLWQYGIGDWGPYVRLTFSGAIPLWTFGKLSGMQDAAQAGVEAARGGIERARRQVAWEVRRAYLSFLFARDVLYLISDGRGYLDDAREEVRGRIDAGEGGGSTIDLYKIDAMTADVDARELGARRIEEIALAGLRLLAGLGPDAEVADLPIEPFPVERRPVEDYVDIARRERPELRMLEHGIEAQEAKVRYERARFYPDLALGVSAGFAYSNVADDQTLPWFSDPFNYATYGVALVLDYPLDFGMDYWRVEEAEATLGALGEQRDALLQGVQAEVAEAYAAIEEAEGRVEAYDAGRLAAKRWLVAVLQGMTLGLHEASDLTDGLVAYFQGEASYLNAVYDLDVAWARLALATAGDFLDGVEPGE